MHHYRLHRDPRSSHQQILQHVLRLRRQPILDVGAAQGILGRLAQGSGLAIDAVERDPQWAREARPFYREVFDTAVEQAPLTPRTYRLIVCGDVLEHTVDPVAILRRLDDAAADDVLFVVSVPNVAHLAVRLMLLFGYFPRMDRGVLDRTHLHFFTRDTARQMLCEAGLRVLHSSATVLPLDELWPGAQARLGYRLLAGLQRVAVTLAPRLFGYQWVMLAERVPRAAAPP